MSNGIGAWLLSSSSKEDHHSSYKYGGHYARPLLERYIISLKLVVKQVERLVSIIERQY